MKNKTKTEEVLQQIMDEEKKSEKAHQKEAEPLHKLHDDTDHRIDVLNLPPRKEVHSNNKRTQLKISSQLTRFILVIIVLFGVLILAYYITGENF